MKVTEQQIREEQDELLVNKEFEALLADYINSNHRQKVDIIRKAFNFAKAAHRGVRRRSGEPYILHPIAVAKIVVNEIGLGSTSICAALLHDVVEDADYSVEDLEGVFGTKIAHIVDGLTKISGGVFGTRDSVQAENFRRLLLTMSEDIRVVLIKIADRLHNMRTLSSMMPAKQYKIAGETMYIYAPLALRLGLFRIKSELENLSFKYEHSEIYNQLSERLMDTHQERSGFAQAFQQKIEDKLHELGYEFTMKGRVKTPYSVWHKMQTENIPFEEVYDKLAFRIVFKPKEGMSEKDQCWMLYSAITTLYKPHPERIRDWVSTPKANGYEALHITVMGPHGKWVEVQIRSERMHEIAEHGLAAHWKYKDGNDYNETELDKWLKTIKELLENNDPSAIDFIDTIKLDLFASEIFVFTPKGDIKIIAQGASALDFAFAIHTDLGKHCIGAKANHKLVPLSYTLQSGDQVEIITSRKQLPQREWLNFVTTARAKQKLQAFFRQEDKKLIATGEKQLQEALKLLNINIDNQNIAKVLNHFNLTSPDALFLEIGKQLLNLDELGKVVFKGNSKNILLRYLKKAFQNPNNPDKNGSNKQVAINRSFKIDMKQTLMLTEETAGKLYKLAPCCHPIPGDDVLGYVDEETGVTIHKRACPVANKLKSNFGDRIVSAQWATHKLNSYLEQIEIKGIDKKGVFIEILQVISNKYGFNVSKINVESIDGIFIGQVFVYVHDTNEINELCRQLEKNSHIQSVTRIQSIVEV
ncbi:MAG: RelA/SpoT family protein [Prevotellaceae bacterium]|jgi:GTP pyrophosphokinase|nr:RelA/SpoT family protein [Prevotellaceae bacterium]